MIPKTKKLLAETIQKNQRRISEWYMNHARVAPPPFYCSVDLRDSGHKIVPVDSNLYPAGFNNVCPEDLRTAPSILKAHLDAYFNRTQSGRPVGNKVMIVPESHTSNLFYIENLYYLTQIFKNAGFDVQVGWYGNLPEGTSAPLILKSATGKEVEARPFAVKGNQLVIETGPNGSGGGFNGGADFVPDLVLLNNDFSSGYPKIFDGITQPILPSHILGWHSRKKSEHFKYYNQLAGELAEILEIDPWLIQIDTEEVSPVNFGEDEGTELVAQSVERVLQRTQAAYDHHKIATKPFVFVKNNSGTYGMGIMVVHSADELRQMNRRTKNKMSVGKNKTPIQSVAVQEGVPTATLVDRLAAEPVIYLLGCELIGGFLRTNTEKGTEDNLNSQGMVFKMLCMSDLRNLENDPDEDNKDVPLLEMIYGAVARVSALATGRELAVHLKDMGIQQNIGAGVTCGN
jgi:glutamate--cysteine ligase